MKKYLHFLVYQARYSFRKMLWLFVLLFPVSGFAQQEFSGQWYEVDENWQLSDPLHNVIESLPLTGGHFVFQSTLTVNDTAETIVIDFKNSSVIGRFHHYLTDSNGDIIAQADGGIQAKTANTFFLRHGREFKLPAGHYQLITHLVSPYFIAEPQPYWDKLQHYREAIKWGSIITLVSIGVLISLGVYYAILASVRKRITESMYTLFILMNVIFNGSSLLITPDLLNIHWFYLAGAPILLSNFAYLLFAKHLLQIRSVSHPRLHNLALVCVFLLSVLLLVALLNKHFVLECARYGVGIIMSYGLIAALVRAYEGYKIAYFYLVAVAAFFVIGSIAISSKDLEGIYTIYIEHIGLLAVTVEVLLIGLVLGYQFAEVYREKEHSLALVQQSLQIAHHDALTGLPNRYALDISMEKLPANGMLTLLDMDNLKLYNDTYGHQKGDEMLQMFARVLSVKLGKLGVLHRMGGDEFAITSETVAVADNIRDVIAETIQYMRKHGFEKAGVSYGSANRIETINLNELRMLADRRMYHQKRSNDRRQWA